VDAGAQAQTDLAAFPAAMARATCEKVDLCCAGAERSRIIGVGDSLPECEITLGSFYGRQYEPAQTLVAMARTEFDAEGWRRCLSAYRAAGCNAPGQAAAASCGQVFVGALPEGAGCSSGFECASRHCPPGAGGAASTCRPRKADGQPCARAGECASGICRTTLFAGACTSQLTDGASCGGDGFWIVF